MAWHQMVVVAGGAVTSWWSALPVALVAAAAILLPGATLLRAAGVRSLVAVAAAPAVTFGVLGVAALGLSAADVRWSRSTVGLLVAVLIVAVAALGRRTRTPGPPSREGRWSVLAATPWVGLGFLVQALPLRRGMGHPGALLQSWDAPFHYSAIEVIRATGDASPFGGLDPLYGDGADGVFYPSLWHAVAGLLPGAAVLVANVMVFVALGVWLLGIAALARVCFPDRPAIALVALLVAGASTAYPAVMIRMSQYPLTMALALLPGLLALAAQVVLRRRDEAARGLPAGRVALVAVAALGLFLVHSSALVALVFALAPLLLLRLGGTVRGLAQRGRWLAAALLTGGLLASVVGGVWAVASSAQVRSMMSFEREVSPVGASLRNALLLDSFGPASPWLNLPLAVAAVLGAGVALRRRSSRWLVLSWAVFLATYAVAYLPPGPWKLLSAFWYNEGSRIQAVTDTLYAPLAAAGLWLVGTAVVRFLTWIVGSRRPARHAAPRRSGHVVTVGALAMALAAGIVVATGGFRAAEKADFWVAPSFATDATARNAYASGEEVELLWRLASALPPDAVVAGDPFNGAAFVPAVTGRRAVPPHVSGGGARASDAQYLLQHFRELRQDPEVCAAIGRLGVTHVYLDVPISVYGWQLEEVNPGMYGVDTSGFGLVDRGGTASVWEVTACDGR